MHTASGRKTVSHWYVVHVRSGRELMAAALIEEHLQFHVQLLEVLQRRHGKLVRVPLFPGYLLMAAGDGLIGPEAVERVPNCGRLLRTGRGLETSLGEPVRLAAEEVGRLCDRVATINAAGGLPAHNLHEGQAVRILVGPLQGLEAVFVGPLTPAARVQVLLQFLGRQQRVEVDSDAVEPATPVKRPRRTRGQGRQIRT